MSFIPVFGGTSLSPSNQNYSEIEISEDGVITWSLESQAGVGFPIASHMAVDPTVASLELALPNAMQGSNGWATLFTNIGANTVIITDYEGNTVLSLAPGLSWYVYLENNSTEAGNWGSLQFGASVSAANAAALVGAGIKAIGSTLNQKVDVEAKSANYAVLNADRAKLLLWTGGNGDYTLPAPATLGTDWFVLVRNSGNGSLTITPTSGEIDDAVNLLVSSGESAIIITDGANYYTVGFGQAPNSVFDYISISIAGTGDYVLAGAQLNRISYNLTGILTGNRNLIVPATVQQYWVQNNTTGAFTLTVKTAAGTGVEIPQGSAAIVFSDGTNVVNASNSSGITLPLAIAQGGTSQTSAPNALVALGAKAASDFTNGSSTTFTPSAGLTSITDDNAIFSKTDTVASIFLDIKGDINGSASIDWAVGSIPAAYRPAAARYFGIITMVPLGGGASELVLFSVFADGSAQMSRVSGSNFGTGASMWFGGSVTYPLG